MKEELEALRLKVKLAQIESRRKVWESIAEWWPLLAIAALASLPTCLYILAVALGADLD